MSPQVIDVPVGARADRSAPASIAAVRRMPAADSTPRPLLTKRRPVDFGLVTSCLCRLR